MPYIPMTIGQKRAIVRQRLKNMGIIVPVTDSWLDVQITCKNNGLDITEMLTPQIPDRLLLGKDNEKKVKEESSTKLIAQKGAKIIDPTKEEKSAIGFLPKAEKAVVEPVSNEDDDVEHYTL